MDKGLRLAHAIVVPCQGPVRAGAHSALEAGMVHNSARKRDVRAAAALSGSKYTVALRELEKAERHQSHSRVTQQSRMRVNGKREAAALRSGYTGESRIAAEAGVKGRGDLGLDSSNIEQQKFRALLALALLNKGRIAPAGMDWQCSTFSAYDPIISSREDELLVVDSRAPDNVTGWLLPTGSPGGPVRVPGLRLEAVDESDHATYVMRHIPTGARFIVTSGPTSDVPPDAHCTTPWRDHLTVRDELTPAEVEALGLIPKMTDAAGRLLAGLITRYTLEDPAGQWATSWDWDPLERPGDRRSERLPLREGVQRRLWGEGNSWELRWTGYPYPEDLAIALTHPAVGVSGARLSRHRDTYEVSLGDAILELRPWRV